MLHNTENKTNLEWNLDNLQFTDKFNKISKSSFDGLIDTKINSLSTLLKDTEGKSPKILIQELAALIRDKFAEQYEELGKFASVANGFQELYGTNELLVETV